MNGRYVHVSFSLREEKERHIYSLKSVCFYEKQNTSTIFTCTSLIFFPFIFLSGSKEGWFVLKGFHCNKNHLTEAPVWGRTKEKVFLF